MIRKPASARAARNLAGQRRRLLHVGTLWFGSDHGTRTGDCKLSSSYSRCSRLYQHHKGPSSVVPVCHRPNIACSAHLHRLPVQCASFTFSTFLGNIYNRISYHGKCIAPILNVCWLKLNFYSVGVEVSFRISSLGSPHQCSILLVQL